MTVSYSGSFFRLLLRWKGSIWKSVWFELVVFLILFYSIRFTYSHIFPIIDPDEKEGYKKIMRLIAVQFNEYTKLIPLTFLLGFYVSNVVSRWWRQFECLSWPEDILSVVCMVIPGADERSQKLRHQIARYLNLTAALAWRDISDKIRRRFPQVSNLIDAGILTDNEYRILQKIHARTAGARWLTPLHWAQQLIATEIASGQAQNQYISTLSNELKQFRTSFRRLFCHDWVCVPLVYTQVAAMATYSFFFFCLFGRQYFDDDESTVDLFVPLFTIVQFLFFVGWFKVGQDLMRPFGMDDDDIELSYILDRNLVISFTIVNILQTQQPPPFEADVFWQYMEHEGATPYHRSDDSCLLFGRIDLSRNCHKHPPKLHTDEDIEEQIQCLPGERKEKFISW